MKIVAKIVAIGENPNWLALRYVCSDGTMFRFKHEALAHEGEVK